jgi:hypothetical protein
LQAVEKVGSTVMTDKIYVYLWGSGTKYGVGEADAGLFPHPVRDPLGTATMSSR